MTNQTKRMHVLEEQVRQKELSLLKSQIEAEKRVLEQSRHITSRTLDHTFHQNNQQTFEREQSSKNDSLYNTGYQTQPLNRFAKSSFNKHEYGSDVSDNQETVFTPYHQRISSYDKTNQNFAVESNHSHVDSPINSNKNYTSFAERIENENKAQL